MKPVAALLLAWVVTAAAETVPAPGTVDPRIRTVVFNAHDVVRLQGFIGYAIELELEDGERVVNVAAGDTAALDVGIEGSHVLLKPRQAIPGMNLTILTDRRSYRLDYHAVRVVGEPARRDLIYALRFAFPERLAASAPAAAPRRNADYWYCGHRSLRPTAAFDDGIQTHLRFSARTELPAAFAGEEDGTESLVNSHFDGDWLVLHRVGRRFVLREGRLVGCVENRDFARPTPRAGDSGRPIRTPGSGGSEP